MKVVAMGKDRAISMVPNIDGDIVWAYSLAVMDEEQVRVGIRMREGTSRRPVIIIPFKWDGEARLLTWEEADDGPAVEVA